MLEQNKLLLANLRAGGNVREQAITNLYREYAGRMRAYFINHRASASDADDWVQECFVRIVKSIDSFRGDSPLAAWIWTIARNVMLDALRKKNPSAPVDDALLFNLVSENTDHIEHLQDEELEDCVNKRFGEFQTNEPERAQLIVWAVIDKLRMKDIAEILGRTPGATREYVSQCRKKLRGYLEPCLELLH